jgi:hypothetical protein
VGGARHVEYPQWVMKRKKKEKKGKQEEIGKQRF